ncbi:hypothetical protein AK830_g8788 [Neonectria ditissima]|uniref:Uncharacterized protein n=1 Tax=Neonectria ditissima TaxID=78410 RepID=A0A0P7AJZ8_9HYPO|nr:hypothetical protein AK830_g8788 [Neonectria ditissima]
MDSPITNQLDSTTQSPSFSTASFFSSTAASSSSTAETTPATTPGLRSEDDPYDTCKIGSKPLPALQREFPKPAQDVDVKSLLERPPGRWTIQGQIAANQHRAATKLNEEVKERRQQDLETAKKDILALHGGLRLPDQSSRGI